MSDNQTIHKFVTTGLVLQEVLKRILKIEMKEQYLLPRKHTYVHSSQTLQSNYTMTSTKQPATTTMTASELTDQHQT